MLFRGYIILLLPAVLAFSRRQMILKSQVQANNPVRESGINKEIIKPGTGQRVEVGDILEVQYKAFIKGSQEPFAQGSRETFVVKDGSMIECWDLAVTSMELKEKAMFHCKADLAYGKDGISNVIPANTDIVLEIEVLAWLGNQLRSETDKKVDDNPFEGRNLGSPPAAYEDKKVKQENMFSGSVLDIYKRRLASASFGFAGSGFFTSQSGEKAPWYLNPNLTFPAMIAIVSAAFLTVFLNGAVREKGISIGGGEVISREFLTKSVREFNTDIESARVWIAFDSLFEALEYLCEMFNSPSICSVNYQARALCPQYGTKERHRFLVGTCSLHDANELSILQYTEDSHHLEVACSFAHPDQIWGIAASPKDASLVVTSRQSQNSSKSLTMWKMPNQDPSDYQEDIRVSFNSEQLELTEVASFNHSQKATYVRDIKWHSSGKSLLTVDNKMLSTWSIGEGKISQENALALDMHTPKGDTGNVFSHVEEGCVAWDPHSSKQCAVGIGSSLKLVDTREMEVTAEHHTAHDEAIRSVDYNPNKPLVLITAGDDRKVKFWDSRNLGRPTKVLAGHSHWVWSAKFNPHHDQLIISGGSDNLVNLWRIASCSSAPWLGSEDNSNDPPDVKVRSIDQHEDSVYGVAWSPADAWIYCSLSYDGRVIVNHVPSTEKYKILL